MQGSESAQAERMSDLDAAHKMLRSVFGFSAFRDGQADIIAAILAGRDVLAIMPTGSGKSLCYQLPALLRDGLTIVVSPLIALMRNQVGAAQELRHRRRRAQFRQRFFREPRHRRADRAGRIAARLHRAGAAGEAGIMALLRDREARDAGGRRGALHLAMGPRLPSRLHEHRDAARRARHRPDASPSPRRPTRRRAAMSSPGCSRRRRSCSSTASTGRTCASP